MSNKQQLQTNNTNLDALIARVNVAKDTTASLPDGGSGGSGDTSAEDSFLTKTITTYANDRVSNIRDCAFYNCTNLTSVSFPACINIGVSAFRSCSSLTSANFPACINIGSSAFQFCSGLSSIYLLTSSVCTLANSNAFSGTSIWSTRGSIFVPASLVDSYKAATNWTFFSNRIFAYS